jgi:hypothetical protein
MASTAYEITGSFGNIVSDDEILFPNVLSCVAVVCRVGGGLVGVHITLADRGRLSEVATYVMNRYGRPSDVYVIGPVLGAYNVNGFANFDCPIRVHDCSGGIDVRAASSNGSLTFGTRTAGGGGGGRGGRGGGGGGWTNLPVERFL